MRPGLGQGGQQGCVFSNDVWKYHEARVVLAREQRAPLGTGRPEATPPRAPCALSLGIEESPRTCCTCCYCLRAPSHRPASRTPRPQNPGAAPRCYWRSRSFGRRPVRWRWPGPGSKPRERVGRGTCAWALTGSPPGAPPGRPSARVSRVHAPTQVPRSLSNLANSFSVPSSPPPANPGRRERGDFVDTNPAGRC